jgi:hypothetical protein
LLFLFCQVFPRSTHNSYSVSRIRSTVSCGALAAVAMVMGVMYARRIVGNLPVRAV